MISFHTEDIKFSLKSRALLKQWMTSVIEKRGYKTGDVTFIFCSDDYLLKMNKEYLNHNTYTDIITFDYSEQFPLVKGIRSERTPSEGIHGDIFISIERVKENANQFSKSVEEELHRVMIHGVLHLLGYKDKTKAAKAEMTKQENVCLKELKKMAR